MKFFFVDLIKASVAVMDCTLLMLILPLKLGEGSEKFRGPTLVKDGDKD